MKTVVEAFHQQADAYDAWFDIHDEIYQHELSALKAIQVQHSGIHVEIGCGTGRFGIPLGYDIGIDPCSEMLKKCRM